VITIAFQSGAVEREMSKAMDAVLKSIFSGAELLLLCQISCPALLLVITTNEQSAVELPHNNV